MTPSNFVKALSTVQLDAVFNPYSERCDLYDRADAPKRRRANLRGFLDAVSATGVDSVWIARDLGYRGGRRTGLPLTDEAHLDVFGKIYGRSPVRATKGDPMAERTAAVIWNVLKDIDRPIFLWNIFPLHPFELGDPLSNRCHTRAEREMFSDVLWALLDMLRPGRIVAIGRDAHKALADLDLDALPVRHPSYGGQTDFVRGMHEIYGCPSRAPAG
jgi:uracil-DNA glycosylase